MKKSEAEMIVAALSAQTDQSLLAVEVKEKGETSYVISSSTDNIPSVGDLNPKSDYGVKSFANIRLGHRGFSVGPGMKLVKNTVITVVELGLGQDGDQGTGILTALSFKVDPLALTNSPIRVTAGYRVFKLSMDYNPVVNTKGRGPTVGVIVPINNKFEFYLDGMFSNSTQIFKDFHKDENGRYLLSQWEGYRVYGPGTTTARSKKTIITSGFSFRF